MISLIEIMDAGFKWGFDKNTSAPRLTLLAITLVLPPLELVYGGAIISATVSGNNLITAVIIDIVFCIAAICWMSSILESARMKIAIGAP